MFVGNWIWNQNPRLWTPGRQTQPAPALWSGSVLPEKGCEAGPTEGPPWRQWKERHSLSTLPAARFSRKEGRGRVELCVCPSDLPRDHHRGRWGAGWPLRN